MSSKNLTINNLKMYLSSASMGSDTMTLDQFLEKLDHLDFERKLNKQLVREVVQSRFARA
jgi:hypothetical protein